jgi:PAS domain S-box/PAS domain S-box/PAS domain S-box
MDDKKKYKDLEERCRKLENELNELRLKGHGAAKSSSEMVNHVFHSASQAIAISKLDTGEFVDVNESFLSMLGYSREEVIGRNADDLKLFTDISQISKYIKILTKLKSIKDFVTTLRTKEGIEKNILFSAETLRLVDEDYLITFYNPFFSKKGKKINKNRADLLEEIFNTVSSYLALFDVDEDGRFVIVDINSKVESVEFIDKNEVTGKYLDETPLVNRVKLVELLNHLRIAREPHKLPASPVGDDSEGYYVGFIIRNGSYVISWEPGRQQKNDEDLNRQSVLFEKLADMLPEMIYEVDLTGRVLFANAHGIKYFGYSKEDYVKGLNISDIFPNDYKQMISNLASLKSPEDISSNEYYARKKDGSLLPIVTHSFATFNNGKITGYLGTVTDISKQKQYEEQIKREKVFLEHLIDSTPEAIAMTDIPGTVTMVNKEFSNLFGYSSEEALNKNIDDLIVPDELRDEAAEIEALAFEHEKITRQTVRKDKAGNRIQVTLVATSIIVNNETVSFLGIYRDIGTERKNQLLQEILYNISSEALKQMDIKEIYPTIVHELSKIWDTNNFFIAIYDKESDTLSLPFFADEKDNFQEIPTKKTITGYVIKTNKSVLLRENDLRLLEESGDIDLVGTDCKVWMGVPLKVENNIIGVMCLQDYNDENKFSQDDLYVLDFIANQIAIAIQRRIMLDNLVVARQKAEEAAQSKQIFMSTMSHEIRTPLNEVIGITNLLLQGNPREDQMDYIKTLRFSGNHLLTLVNDVLDYNKMESGKIIFEQVQFNLNDFLDEIMRSYSFRSKAKHLDFEIRKEGNLPVEVIGDQIRLNQILSNLLSNALKFTNQGGITVVIRELERSGNQSKMEFSVRDTGIGIPMDKHSSIFESFAQAAPDTTRNFGGTGLGLAICKKLIELQGGTIEVESEPGQGSRFTFVLKFQVSEKGSHAREGEPAESFIGLERKRILVAEDNKINFFVANKFLTGWGVIVTHAENGLVAIDKIKEEEFDLILMDLHMPVMDGIEATKILRSSADPKISSIPIVALTAAIMSESHDKIEELNINDYVLKPFKPHDLFSRILKHIR